jgi:hypothetical protein
MVKNLLCNYLKTFFVKLYVPCSIVCSMFPTSLKKVSWPLMISILALFCTNGCIQNYGISTQNLVQYDSLKGASSDNKFQLDGLGDAYQHLELDFHPQVSKTLFLAKGYTILWGNSTLPYLLLKATLLNKDHIITTTKYMMISVEPKKRYDFDIQQNLRIALGDYDCILEASGPNGQIFSEKRHCLSIFESEDNKQIKDLKSEEQSRQDSLIQAGTLKGESKSNNQKQLIEKKSFGNQSSSSHLLNEGLLASENEKNIRSKAAFSNEGTKSKSISGPYSPHISNISKTNVETELGETSPNVNDSTVPVEGTFVGSTSSDKYHMLNCRYVTKIKNKIYFKSSDEARRKGKVPCKACNPS